MENVYSHYTSHLYALLTSGIRRLMDGMLLNSMAFLHALTAALVDDCRKAFFGNTSYAQSWDMWKTRYYNM